MSRDRTDASETDTVTEAKSGGETSRPDIECCIDNVDIDSYRAMEAGNKSINSQYCLQRCGICYRESFLVVDGDVITGADHLALLDTLDLEGSSDA